MKIKNVRRTRLLPLSTRVFVATGGLSLNNLQQCPPLATLARSRLSHSIALAVVSVETLVELAVIWIFGSH